MTLSSETLIQDLLARNQAVIDQIHTILENLSPEALHWKAHPSKWSIVECLEHLNLYGDFYIPEIQRVLNKAPQITSPSDFKSGWLGNYFAQSMLPKAGKVSNAMKTFKDKDPSNDQLPPEVIPRFFAQQADYMRLLEAAKSVDLNKNKTGISLTKWIQLRLGDTLRVVIYHHQRHLVQILGTADGWQQRV